jgi:probable F420-dependent oxidoreductase
MRIGVVFPQTEIGANPDDLITYARGVEELGYTHLLAYDHVIGADTANRPNWSGPYTIETQFHEPFVLFGYLAAVTGLEFVTGIIILPQRQTVLVAKQAVEVDVLSRGRFRLGIGLGWNQVEYQALNENFRNRGKRSEEQIELLRRLFTEPVVTFHGKWHTVEEAGLLPMPVQRPIPIWLGGSQDVTLRRIARLGDGWMPQMPPNDQARALMQKLREYTQEAGRDPNSIGIESRTSVSSGGPEDWREQVEGWRGLGATHLSVNTMGAGLNGVQAHLDALKRFMDAVGS